mgnify:CR=1 FL=1
MRVRPLSHLPDWPQELPEPGPLVPPRVYPFDGQPPAIRDLPEMVAASRWTHLEDSLAFLFPPSVVPLGTYQASNFTLEPACPGFWFWRSPNVLIFTPDIPLSPGTYRFQQLEVVIQ